MRPAPFKLVRIKGVMFTAIGKTKRALQTSATQRHQHPSVSKPNLTPLRSGKNSLLRGLLAVGVALGGAGQDLLGDQAGVLADRGLDLRGHVRIGLEERL